MRPRPSSEHMEGITLYCGNEVDSKYSVEGVNLTNPAFCRRDLGQPRPRGFG